MRHTTLLALVAFAAPALAAAADVPALVSYTISNTTICPTAPNLCPPSTTIDVAFNEKVKATIQIMGPDGSSNDFYSSSGVTDPNPRVWDGTVNNKGQTIVPDGIYTILISASSYDDPKLTMTDSSRTVAVSSTGGGDTPGGATTTPSGSGGSSTYVPPPSTIGILMNGPTSALLNVPLRFTAQVNTKGGIVDSAAQIFWSFGDGSSQTGTAVEKVYRYPGTYLVTVHASDGSARASADEVVTVHSAGVRVSVSSEGIVITNETDTRLDLSNWRLTADVGFFRIPEGTTLLPNASVLFPYAITNLPMTEDAALLYPNMLVAAYASPSESGVQPSSPSMGSYSVQAVDSNPNATPNLQSYDQAVVAPTAAIELAAVGAPLPPASSTGLAAVAAAPSLWSPWLMGLMGIIVVAGGAFIFI